MEQPDICVTSVMMPPKAKANEGRPAPRCSWKETMTPFAPALLAVGLVVGVPGLHRAPPTAPCGPRPPGSDGGFHVPDAGWM